jgi:hypothetical protein
MELNREIIKKHIQKYEKSCTPSAVEMVLKLLDKVNCDYCDLQDFCGNEGMNFSIFDKKIIRKIKFIKLFENPRTDTFPINDLFNKINEEIKVGRYVIISLYSGKDPNGNNCYHNHIIYDTNVVSGEYLAFTKHYGSDNIIETHGTMNIKNKVVKMKGTDILTYLLE